jgi:hypothetical protein
LRGLAPGGDPDPYYRGRELARNSAIGELALATGMRLQEFSSLLAYEIPAERVANGLDPHRHLGQRQA